MHMHEKYPNTFCSHISTCIHQHIGTHRIQSKYKLSCIIHKWYIWHLYLVFGDMHCRWEEEWPCIHWRVIVLAALIMSKMYKHCFWICCLDPEKEDLMGKLCCIAFFSHHLIVSPSWSSFFVTNMMQETLNTWQVMIPACIGTPIHHICTMICMKNIVDDGVRLKHQVILIDKATACWFQQ